MTNRLQVGDKVTTSGYPGTVIEVPAWTQHMVVIRLASGCTCVDESDVVLVSRITPSVMPSMQALVDRKEAELRARNS